MGGHARDEQGRRRRPLLRRAVLLMAFGVLTGAVFLCWQSGSEVPAPAGAGPRAVHTTHPAHASGAQHAVCVAPYDRPGCSPLSHVLPGLVPPEPPAVTVARGAPAPAVRPAPAAGLRAPSALARGPDLYALQVLRT